MATTVILATAHKDGVPLGRPKLSQDVTPSGSYQYLQIPRANKGGDQADCLVVLDTDAAILVDIVDGAADASDTKAVRVRVPAGGLRSYVCYAVHGQRVAFKTLS